MPVLLHCKQFPLSDEETQALWQEVVASRGISDDQVAVQCISSEHIQELNRKYRKKDRPTNVLTFSYDQEHDILICMEIAQQEARQRQCSDRDYTALLLVHGFLHATGLDHEASPSAAAATQEAEAAILTAAGFQSLTL